MIGEIKELLLNVFFIILPLFLYQIFWIDREKLNSKWSNLAVILFSLLSILLCMSFPITFSQGFHFDLRQIPFILIGLYMGYKASVWLYLGILGYRFFLGGDGANVNFYVITSLFLFVPLLKSKFLTLTFKKKMTLTTAIAFISACLMTITADLFTNITSEFSLGFIGIQIFGIFLTTYLIETTIRKNIHIRNDIIKSEKMKVISQLAASISHEVRNPLTTSRGLLQLMNETEFTPDKKSELFAIAISELDRAQMIITDYLSLAKTQSEKKETLNIVEELKHVIDVLIPYANMKSVELYMTSKEASCYVEADKQRFRQCFINIVKNSIEAISNHGTVLLKLYISENNAAIEIQDTGCGMTTEQIRKLGTPYYSTKETGTGLGMMVVYNIINTMNGKINITSDPGIGTCFSIILPLKKYASKEMELIEKAI